MRPTAASLASLVGKPWGVADFLRIAIALARELERIHATGAVHNDVRPSNVVVTVATGEVVLGAVRPLATPLHADAPPYMSPEQHGRTNRGIDTRSDLYGFGMILYEMLVGALPVDRGEPLEILHWHLAREPAIPDGSPRNVTTAISHIVRKLVRKAPEDRYQTTVGVEWDLRRCLEIWQSGDLGAGFEIGEHDFADRLVAPRGLHGRDREVAELANAVTRAAAQRRLGLALVTGPAGIGKSVVARSLQASSHVVFVAGKCQPETRGAPYAVLVEVLRELVRTALALPEAELAATRTAIERALGPNGRLIAELVPELLLVVGEMPPVPELEPREAKHRRHLTLHRLLGACARGSRTLVILLDDVQWIDPATLAWLEDELSNSDEQRLLIVCAYRDDEVSAADNLARLITRARADGRVLATIPVAPLRLVELAGVLGDVLACDPREVEDLTEIVLAKTAGNPFFALQLITALHEGRLVTFDREARKWTWSSDRVRAEPITDNVVALALSRARTLSAPARTTLHALACLGTATTAQLAVALAIHDPAPALAESIAMGIVTRGDDVYRFVHDRLAEAAYALIPTDDRAATHLEIGRRLLESAPRDDSWLFAIVNQLDHGADLVSSPAERLRNATVDLRAGRVSLTAGAHVVAATYFAAGSRLLGDARTNEMRELAFELELRRAECEHLAGSHAASLDRLAALAPHAHGMIERAAVARLQMRAHLATSAQAKAVAVAHAYLANAQVPWSTEPSEDEVAGELARLRAVISGLEDPAITAPMMTDPELEATVNLLVDLTDSASWVDHRVHDLAIVRAVDLGLRFGRCDASGFALVTLGLIIGARGGTYAEAHRVGRLGLEVAKLGPSTRLLGRTFVAYGGYLAHLGEPFEVAVELTRHGCELAAANGETFHVVLALIQESGLAFFGGLSLEACARVNDAGRAFFAKAGFSAFSPVGDALAVLVRGLRGIAAGAEPTGAPIALDLPGRCLVESYRAIESYFSGDFADACIATACCAAALRESVSARLRLSPMFVGHHVFGALAEIAIIDELPLVDREDHLAAARGMREVVVPFAAVAPAYAAWLSLIDAELARIEGRTRDAEAQYDTTLELARRSGRIHIEAVANERAARLYGAHGRERIAHAYLEEAREAYRQWGAHGKVRALDRSHPKLARRARSTGDSSTQVDHAALVRLSQLLIRDLDLDQVIRSLLRLALEHAGAQRGLLFVVDPDELKCVAEATTSAAGVDITLASTARACDAIVRFSARTLEVVTVDDAGEAGGQFAGDGYVIVERSRSILCIPLVEQGELVGVLYLENKLVPHAFSHPGVTLLELLASHAAAALAHARVYQELRTENATRMRVETELRRNQTYVAEAQRQSRTGSYVWNTVTGMLTISETYAELLGFPRGHMPSPKEIATRTHIDDHAMIHTSYAIAVADRRDVSIEHRCVLPNGEVRTFLAWVRPMVNVAGELECVGAVMDITDRKRAQAELEWRVHISDVSASLGGASAEQVGERIPGALEIVARFFDADRIVITSLQGERPLSSYSWARPGVAPPVDLGSERVGVILDALRRREAVYVSTDPHDADADVRAVLDGHGIRAVYAMPLVIGGDVIAALGFSWMRQRIELGDEQTRQLQLLAQIFASALSRQRAAAELAQSAAALELSQRELAYVTRVTTLGELAASIAHEINQPLTAIVANATACINWLAHAQPDLAIVRDTLSHMSRDGARAADVVMRIRALLSRSPIELAPCGVVAVIDAVIPLLRGQLDRDRVILESRLDRDLPDVLGDPTQLQQVVLNLVINAAEASRDLAEERRRVIVTASAETPGAIVVAVADRGVGLAAIDIPRLFETFYTTKPTGLGMGLSISRSIVDRHGGRLWAEPNPEGGATFRFSLPALA